MLLTVPGQTIVEPVTLAQLKDALKIVSTADDTLLTGNITAAREFAERISNRCLAPRQFMEYRDNFPYPGAPLLLPRPPLATVDLVEYLEDDYSTWTTWAASEYWVATYNAPAILQPRKGFTYPTTLPQTAGCVRITFTAGSSAPLDLAEAISKTIIDVSAFMYENVGAPVPTTLVTVPKIHSF